MTPARPRGTPSWLGSVNERTAMALALEHGVITRTRLSELSGLSKPTTSQVVTRLVDAGLLREHGRLAVGRGPHAVGYAPVVDGFLGVAIEVTREELTATLVDPTGTEHPVVRWTRQHCAQLTAGGPQDGAACAVAQVRVIATAAAQAGGHNPGDVEHLLLAVPGSATGVEREAWVADELAPWPVRDLRTDLAHGLGLEVVLERDARMAALAQLRASEGDDFCLVWLGTGLALVQVVDGRIVRGCHDRAGEVGLIVAPGPDRRATYHSLLGGEALTERARQLGLDGDYPALLDALASPAGALEQLWEELAERLTSLLVPMLHASDPGRVVLAGPTGAAGGQRLAELTARHLAAWGAWSVETTPIALGRSAVLDGARAHLLETLRAAVLAQLRSRRAFDESDPERELISEALS